MNSKRKQLRDISNNCTNYESSNKKQLTNDARDFLPILADADHAEPTVRGVDVVEPVLLIVEPSVLQNEHPLHRFYKNDLVTDTMSYDQLLELLSKEKEIQLIDFLSQIGVIASKQQCEFCGGDMRKMKQGNTWYWICTRRVNGVKCNRGKFSIRNGTLFDNSKLSIQTTLMILWNFLHLLTEQQCKDFCNIGHRTNNTVVDYYGDFRDVCNHWIRDPENKPKLGGFGKVVEMDESYFPGKPKYNRGRRLGTTWKDYEKWAFALVQRDSLDCVVEQVDSNRSRKTLLPIINANCETGTIFNSDSWKAYNQLAEHLNLEDVVYFPVNHTNNYVDPTTGAHTQTVEGLWRHLKDFLPSFGLRPSALRSYIGHFMWHRYCKQRKLDVFKHFLKCAAEVRPPVQKSLPSGEINVAL